MIRMFESSTAWPEEEGRALTDFRPPEPPDISVDFEGGRVVVEDRGEVVTYVLSMGYGRGRAARCGWTEILRDRDGKPVETGVTTAEVMAVLRDVGREQDAVRMTLATAAFFEQAEDCWQAQKIADAAAQRGPRRAQPAPRLAAAAPGADPRAARRRRVAVRHVRARRLRRQARRSSTPRGSSAAPGSCPTAARRPASCASPAPPTTRSSAGSSAPPAPSRTSWGSEMAGNAKTLTTFRDRSGRAHKVVLMADRLVLDLIDREPPRVLALLRHDEGIEQAEAIVFGTDAEEGYAERAKRERDPLCRPLDPADLSAEVPRPRPVEPDDDWPVAA